jgi:cyanophycinase-like exopeptidase
VVGKGAVWVFDGRITHSNAGEAAEEDVLAITDSAVHVLPCDYSFDLESLRPHKPDGSQVQGRS